MYKYKNAVIGLLFPIISTSAQTFSGVPIELSCGLKHNPQIIQNEDQFNMLGCGTTLPQYSFNETLIGSSIKTGGMPVVGFHVSGQRQGSQICIKLSVALDGYNDSNITEPVWFSIPKIKDTDRITVDVEYRYLDICRECEVFELPPCIGENTHVLIQSDKEYMEQFNYEGNIPQIDFNKYALIGYTFRAAGAVSNKKSRYYFLVHPQTGFTDITIIRVGPGLGQYVNYKWMIWFTVPKYLLNTKLNIYYNHF